MSWLLCSQRTQAQALTFQHGRDTDVMGLVLPCRCTTSEHVGINLDIKVNVHVLRKEISSPQLRDPNGKQNKA